MARNNNIFNVQVTNFQKIFFVYHFIKEFEQKYYTTVLHCRKICKIFLKIINL